jgi:hypothetical protein
MTPAAHASTLDRLAALRTELIEQAYALERQGRLDAADVAIATSQRIGEVCEEFQTVGDE